MGYLFAIEVKVCPSLELVTATPTRSVPLVIRHSRPSGSIYIFAMLAEPLSFANTLTFPSIDLQLLVHVYGGGLTRKTSSLLICKLCQVNSKLFALPPSCPLGVFKESEFEKTPANTGALGRT